MDLESARVDWMLLRSDEVPTIFSIECVVRKRSDMCRDMFF